MEECRGLGPVGEIDAEEGRRHLWSWQAGTWRGDGTLTLSSQVKMVVGEAEMGM